MVDIDLAETAVSTATFLNLNDLSADIGWIFELSDQVQLVANLAHGFRAPNIFDMGTLGERPGNRFNIPNPTLNTEYVTQFDTGIRTFHINCLSVQPDIIPLSFNCGSRLFNARRVVLTIGGIA